jgi:predicted metal-dependent HD superfamily phosphohydrolase
MDDKRARDWALEWIGRNLDPQRWCYHHLWHIRHVAEDVAEFGCAAGVSAGELSCLVSAAWLHDTGYATDPRRHEEASAKIAREVLPGLGATAAETELVASLILATWPVLTPHTPLEKLMRDADVGQLGTPNFLEAALLLRRELERGGKVFTEHEFWSFERNFLARIDFFTDIAKKLRGPGLERSRALVVEKLARLEEGGRA